jgi:hypothetical protein
MHLIVKAPKQTGKLLAQPALQSPIGQRSRHDGLVWDETRVGLRSNKSLLRAFQMLETIFF